MYDQMIKIINVFSKIKNNPLTKPYNNLKHMNDISTYKIYKIYNIYSEYSNYIQY